MCAKKQLHKICKYKHTMYDSQISMYKIASDAIKISQYLLYTPNEKYDNRYKLLRAIIS